MYMYIYQFICGFYALSDQLLKFIVYCSHLFRISPTLIARSLMKKHNHSFLHVSGGSDTYCSTPDGINDDQDELTEKVSIILILSNYIQVGVGDSSDD